MGDIQLDLEKANEAMDRKEYDLAGFICTEALKENETRLPESSAVKERLEILLTLSDICKQQDRILDNIKYLDQLIDTARSIDDREMVAKGLVRTGFVFNKLGDRKNAMERFNEAEKLAKDFENRVQYGYALAGKANIYWRTGENNKAIELGKIVLNIGLEHEEYILTAGAANLLSSAWFELANFTEALKAANRSVEIYQRTGNTSDLARALNNRGEIFKRMQVYNMAIESYKEGISVLDTSTVKRFGYLYTNMAECQIRMGYLEEAKISLEKAQEVLKDSEDAYAVACMWFVAGLLDGAHDRTDIAMEWFEMAEKRMEELGVAYDLGIIRKEFARLLKNAGNEKEAMEMALKAMEALGKAGAMDLVEEIKGMMK